MQNRGDQDNCYRNIVFYDGMAHKLDDVMFHFSDKDYLKPWKITSSDGRFEMDFEPILDRVNERDFIIIASLQHQVFGYLSGTVILDDGTKLPIDRLLCAIEVIRKNSKEGQSCETEIYLLSGKAILL